MEEKETILCLAPSTIKKSMFKTETWTIIITNKRFVFAKYTPDIISKEAKERREEAKVQGKNRFGQFLAQASASFSWYTRYNDMTPEEVLKECAENYYLTPKDIINYQLKKGRVYKDEDDVTRDDPHQLVLNTNRGKLVFTTVANYTDLQDALNLLFHSI